MSPRGGGKGRKPRMIFLSEIFFLERDFFSFCLVQMIFLFFFLARSIHVHVIREIQLGLNERIWIKLPCVRLIFKRPFLRIDLFRAHDG